MQQIINVITILGFTICRTTCGQRAAVCTSVSRDCENYWVMVTANVCRHFVWTACVFSVPLTHSPRLVKLFIKHFNQYWIYHSVKFQELFLLVRWFLNVHRVCTVFCPDNGWRHIRRKFQQALIPLLWQCDEINQLSIGREPYFCKLLSSDWCIWDFCNVNRT